VFSRDRGEAVPHNEYADPKAVVQTIIDAARANDPRRLPALCLATSRDDMASLCEATPGTADWARLRASFHDAIIDSVGCQVCHSPV
jgi:hypothetical protein